ncbi:MAG: hypothetical protein R2932_25905 [Caldilineaceae bacterium]
MVEGKGETANRFNVRMAVLRSLNRYELLGETLRYPGISLAIAHPQLLQEQASVEWHKRRPTHRKQAAAEEQSRTS